MLLSRSVPVLVRFRMLGSNVRAFGFRTGIVFTISHLDAMLPLEQHSDDNTDVSDEYVLGELAIRFPKNHASHNTTDFGAPLNQAILGITAMQCGSRPGCVVSVS